MSFELKRTNLIDFTRFILAGAFSLLTILFEIPSLLNQEFRISIFILVALLLHFGMGMCIFKIESKFHDIFQDYRESKGKYIPLIIFSAFLIIFINYLILSTAMLLAGFHHPYILHWESVKLLFLNTFVEFFVVFQLMINNFYKHLLRLYHKNQEMEQNEKDSRYQTLQQQLSPHFLFNSLNTIVAEMNYNVEGAAEFTTKLSQLYRYMLDKQNERISTLESELRIVQLYLDLQNERLGNCIDLDIHITEELMETSLPPLTLQLLIENAIKHNVVSRSKPMTISLYTENSNQWLCVKNPIRRGKHPVSTKVGLRNLSMRYELLCNQPIQIQSDTESFIVKVPIIYEKD